MGEVIGSIIVTQNTYNLWQTALAVVLIVGSVASLGRWLNGRLPKRSDIAELRKALAEVQQKNSNENNSIIAKVREVKSDVRQLGIRLDHHIDRISQEQAQENER